VQDIATQLLIDRIHPLLGDKTITVVISGLPASGKTTLAEELANSFGANAVRVSEDDFGNVPSEVRKEYLREAINAGHMDRLVYLADPLDPRDNPYAPPISRYDWIDLRKCLHELVAGRSYRRDNCWNQKNGKLDKSTTYVAPPRPRGVIFIDSNCPLQFRDQIDLLVLIEIDPSIAAARRAERDAFRTDPGYRAYKQMVDRLHYQPYVGRIREQANFIIQQTSEPGMMSKLISAIPPAPT
jgi:uridine kinase